MPTHHSTLLDSPLPQILPLYLSSPQLGAHEENQSDPTSGKMHRYDSSRGLVDGAADMGRREEGRGEQDRSSKNTSAMDPALQGGFWDTKGDGGYGYLVPLSLPVVSPFSATFDDSSIRKLPNIPLNQEVSQQATRRFQLERPGSWDEVEKPARTHLTEDDARYARQPRQVPSEPLVSPSDLHLINSPLSYTSSDAGKDYFKRSIEGEDEADPSSPAGQSEVHHRVGFDREIGPSVGSGVSRSGTTMTGTTGTEVGLVSGVPQRRVLLRNDSSARQKKGWEAYLPASKWTRIFLLLVFVETIVDIAIQVYLYLRFDRAVTSQFATEAIKANQRKFPVYLAIFAIAHMWQMILAIDGAYHRNTIQIIGLSIFNALFLAWAALQISELRTIFKDTRQIDVDGDTSVSEAIYDIPVDALTGTMLGVIAFVEVGLVTLSWFVYKEMGWQIYHDLGADLRIKAYNFHYQIFVCILRFTAFFYAGFGIQFVWLVLYQTKNGEYWATLALLPISMLVLIWGAVAAHKEAHVWMSGFMAALLGAAGYFVYKVVQLYRRKSTFQDVFKSLTIFAVLSIAITVLALFWSFIVMRNFDKGLKRQRERVSLKRKEKRQGRKQSSNNEVLTVEEAEIEMRRQHRMSID